MAVFDPERKRIVIRVVYDGPGHAGKTTNLRRLTKRYASWRRSDMLSPNTHGERTQFFDWLEVDGGLHRGFPLRAQLLTVPGQRELTLRRKFVIEKADVVVFVADSREAALPEAREFYAELCEQLASLPQPVPIVFQANKQDLPGALEPAKVAKRVCQGLTKPAKVQSSVATSEKGVKQTLAHALRLASSGLRQQWKGRDIKDQAGDAAAVGSAEATLAALTDHESARAAGKRGAPRPSLPSATIPSTHLWPLSSARAVLTQINGQANGQSNGQPSGAVELARVSDPANVEELVLEGGGWRLATGRARHYASEEAGLAALQTLARRKIALASWLPEPSTLALQTAPEEDGGGAWLWAVEPRLPRLAETLRGYDADLRREALARFAEACVGAEALAEHHGLLVDLRPECFAVQEGDRARTRYVGDRLDAGDTVEGLARVLLSLADAHAKDEAAVADYCESLCLGFHHAPVDSTRRAALYGDIAEHEPSSAPGRRTQRALLAVLGRPAHTEGPADGAAPR
ncbi:probable gliding protein mglA [Plesiocystis pacifica SIR-1]|uniref:Probable gliding protein mglA n=1 Tax=Plesiocystis pacifica SIR-1 TaxID=391625 RepID=A6G1B7_9BACT|nr:ADP-ribosylation factor-like protein [Plesiocystis pacifica]EDM80412.1 probable gliding protein mglA [Plesiocystis pacifica SIR-1]